MAINERMKADVTGMVPLFKKDPVGFIKEHSRLRPPVGGALYEQWKSYKIKFFPDKPEITVKPGQLGMYWLRGANTDPKEWQDGESFVMGRPNIDNQVTWNARLADIQSGKAARGCPGAILAMHV